MEAVSAQVQPDGWQQGATLYYRAINLWPRAGPHAQDQFSPEELLDRLHCFLLRMDLPTTSAAVAEGGSVGCCDRRIRLRPDNHGAAATIR